MINYREFPLVDGAPLRNRTVDLLLTIGTICRTSPPGCTDTPADRTQCPDRAGETACRFHGRFHGRSAQCKCRLRRSQIPELPARLASRLPAGAVASRGVVAPRPRGRSPAPGPA